MEKNRKAIDRAKKNIENIILNNFDRNSCLFTISFNENIDNIRYANNEFNKFIKRVRYKLGDFKYIAVLQFKNIGSIKYLMLANIGPSKRKIVFKIWGNGGVWVDWLRYTYSLESIIWKMKGRVGDERLIGKKAYFTSRNLKRY